VWLSHNPADESQDVSLRVDPVKKPKPAVSAKSSPNRSGLAFGRYRVFKELGSGSFANVRSEGLHSSVLVFFRFGHVRLAAVGQIGL